MDAVIAISLLEHLPRPHLGVEEARRVLKPKGFFVVQIPNLQYPIEPHTKFPMLFLLPKRLRLIVMERLNSDHINFELTMKGITELTKNLLFLKRAPLYHGFRTPPWPPSWVFVFQKPPKLARIMRACEQ
jgi:SAM-dependent methyltransferase